MGLQVSNFVCVCVSLGSAPKSKTFDISEQLSNEDIDSAWILTVFVWRVLVISVSDVKILQYPHQRNLIGLE